VAQTAAHLMTRSFGSFGSHSSPWSDPKGLEIVLDLVVVVRFWSREYLALRGPSTYPLEEV